MVYMYHSFLVHLSADGHLGCFHVLAIINSAAMNIGAYMSLSDLVSSVCMPRSGIVFFIILTVYILFPKFSILTITSLKLHKNQTWNQLPRIWLLLQRPSGFPDVTSGKEPACQCKRCKIRRFNPWAGKTPWRRAWQPTLVSCLENPMDREVWWAVQPIGSQRVKVT